MNVGHIPESTHLEDGVHSWTPVSQRKTGEWPCWRCKHRNYHSGTEFGVMFLTCLACGMDTRVKCFFWTAIHNREVGKLWYASNRSRVSQRMKEYYQKKKRSIREFERWRRKHDLDFSLRMAANCKRWREKSDTRPPD